jgi:hypothetical protein
MTALKQPPFKLRSAADHTGHLIPAPKGYTPVIVSFDTTQLTQFQFLLNDQKPNNKHLKNLIVMCQIL